MSGLEAPREHRASSRDLALSVVRDVFGPELRGAQASFAVRARRTSLDARDRAFAADLAYGSIKMRRLIDWYLVPYLGDRKKSLPTAILEILRLGVYQLRVMDGVDDHAAVYETVSLALRYGHKGTAGLVNAILRRIAAEPPAEPERAAFESDDDYLGTRYSLPTWVVTQLRGRFEDRLDEVLAGLAAAPQHAVRVNERALSIEAAESELIGHDLVIRRSTLAGDVLLDTGSTPDDAAGRWFVQSESSAIPVDLLALEPGERVADLCSGRGKKSAQIGARLEDRGAVYCVEKDVRKRPSLERTLALAGIGIASIVIGDATQPLDLPPVDAVLVDAPCSGLGVLGRHPEARWRKRPDDGERLAETQSAILERAATYLRPGGRLVYSVCSTDPREGTERIDGFLHAHPEFARAPLPERFAAFARAGDLVIPPGIEGRDGFTIVRLDRAAGPVA